MRFPSLFNHNHELSPFFNWESSFTNNFPRWVSSEDKIYIDFDMPGMKKEDIKIESKNGFVSISGQRESKVKNSSSYNSFTYHTTLPDGVSEDNIEATYENGVLTLSVAKSTLKLDSKTIKVK